MYFPVLYLVRSIIANSL